MRAIILAAGRGTRMKHLSDDRPKCLLELHGKTLLNRQLEALRESDINDISIVTGYKREMLSGYGLKEFHNPRWAETNMVSSLVCASKWLKDESCIVTYSDIFYSSEAIKLLIKSQRINEKVFLEIKKIVQKHVEQKKRTPIHEIDLAWRIKELGNKYGAEDVSFDPIVAFGKNSAIPHHMPGKTKLKKGDIVLIDMGMKYKGYCSDMTRTFFTSKPKQEHLDIYNTVLEAQLNGLKKIKAETTGKNADAYSRDIIKKAGYAEAYGHAGGHGIGLDIHETPSLSENFTKKFKENTVVTVEPGIYLAGKIGVRIEDMILITKNGNKNLTKITKNPFID